ncbi:hypothetical protein [Lentilactobacillus parakefiri]|nr:hypothetical protein [Lentilactobacillus parakefiri]
MKELIDYIWNMPMWTFIAFAFVAFMMLSDYISSIISAIAHRFKKDTK